MTSKVTDLRPVIDQDDIVVAWRFRLTLTEGAATAFDDIEVAYRYQDGDRPSARKTLAQWTQKEVNALVKAASTDHPKAQQLVKTLAARLRYREVTGFDVSKLPKGDSQ